MTTTAAQAPGPETEQMLREVLDRVADKWTLVVLDALETGGELRFTRIREAVGDISQKK